MKIKLILISLLFSFTAGAAAPVVLNTCPCSSNQVALGKFKKIAVANLGVNANACLFNRSLDHFAPSKKSCGLFTTQELRSMSEKTESAKTPQVGELWVGPFNQAYRVTAVGADPFGFEKNLSRFKVSNRLSSSEVSKEIESFCGDETADASQFKIEVVQLGEDGATLSSVKVVPGLGRAQGNSAWITYLIGRAKSACVKRLSASFAKKIDFKNEPNPWIATLGPNFSAGDCSDGLGDAKK